MGNPRPTIKWYFNGNPVTENELTAYNCETNLPGLYFVQDDRSKLVICHPNYEKHQGKYECLATNKNGKKREFMTLTIYGKHPTVFCCKLLL